MKRLLLSTTLILGTLTGVKGAAAAPVTLDSISGDVAKVQTEVQTLQADLTTINTAVQGHTTDLASALATLATMNTTLQQLVPAAPVVATTTLDTLFISAFTTSANSGRSRALDQIAQQIISTSLYPSITNDALRSIETSINDFINNISNYEPSTIWTPQFFAVFTMCIALDLYLATLFMIGVDKDSNWRLGIFVPMGGASTLGVCLATLTKIFIWWKENETSKTTTKIQKAWLPIFSNPQEKAYLVKLLSRYWISKALDVSKANISLLKKAFSESTNLSGLKANLDPLPTATSNRR